MPTDGSTGLPFDLTLATVIFGASELIAIAQTYAVEVARRRKIAMGTRSVVVSPTPVPVMISVGVSPARVMLVARFFERVVRSVIGSCDCLVVKSVSTR